MRRPGLLIALLLAAAADASVAVRASVEDLAEHAKTVADVTVLDHAAALDSATGTIFTTFRAEVAATLVGEPRTELLVRVRGGRVGRIVQETLGSPELTDGERAVVFLDGEGFVVGMAQGVFRVETDAASGRSVCANSIAGLSLLGAESDSPEPLRMPIEELKTLVAAGRERMEARKEAARKAIERRLAAWRRDAERRAPYLRGRPGGPAER